MALATGGAASRRPRETARFGATSEPGGSRVGVFPAHDLLGKPKLTPKSFKMAIPSSVLRKTFLVTTALAIASIAILVGGWAPWCLMGLVCFSTLVAAPQHEISADESIPDHHKGAKRLLWGALSCGPGSAATAIFMLMTFDSILPTGLLAADPNDHEALLVAVAIVTIALHGTSVIGLFAAINKQIIDPEQRQSSLTRWCLLYYAMIGMGVVGLSLLATMFMGPM